MNKHKLQAKQMEMSYLRQMYWIRSWSTKKKTDNAFESSYRIRLVNLLWRSHILKPLQREVVLLKGRNLNIQNKCWLAEPKEKDGSV